MFLVWNDVAAAPIISKAKMAFYFEISSLEAGDVISRIQTQDASMIKYQELSDVRNYEVCSELLKLLS
jgi:hypothetical protein